MTPVLVCADCGQLAPRRHPLSTRCRQCHLRHRRADKHRRWREKYGSPTKWSKKSKRIRAEVGHCEFCGLTDIDKLTTDHIVTRADGGTDHRYNLRVLCDDCHQELTRTYNMARASRLA